MSEYIVDVNDSSEMYAVEMGRYEGLRELIRCKDCKHWYCYGDETFCSELGIYDTNKDSYCSYAKRKWK